MHPSFVARHRIERPVSMAQLVKGRTKCASAAVAWVPGRTSDPLDTLVVSASPLYGRALCEFLDPGAVGRTCTVVTESELAAMPTASPDGAAVIAPLNWEEMGNWVPDLAKKLAARPWVIVAELRISGMFLWFFEGRSCGLVGSTAAPEEFHSAVRAAAVGRALCPPAALPALLTRYGPPLPDRRIALTPSIRQLEVGCAIASGLNNAQISRLLCLGKGTVKTHVHHLIEELECAGRAEVCTYFQQALAGVAAGLYGRAGARSHSCRKAAWEGFGDRCG